MKKIGSFFLFAALLAGPVMGWGQQPYFQQDVAYDIRVKLDDQNHFLHGFEKLTYRNNSPDTLKEIFLHLWPNAYKNKKSAFAKQKLRDGSTEFWDAPESKRGYIDSLNLQVNGQPVYWTEWKGNPDIARVGLPEPLLPGASFELTTPFRVKLPDSFSRLGHVGQQYQITQWYPKPAVYDRDGWHPMPYLDQGEFYSEFGTFDVYIDVPKNYVVGATGDLTGNPEEEAWLVEREKESRRLLTLPVDSAEFKREFAPDQRKTLHFHQEKVHDFAWFCDQDYYVTTDSVELPHSKRKVKTVAMFTKLDRKYWTKANDYLNKSIYYYSLWNGDYPYNHATAVDGALSAGAGMEYPNITVLGAGGSAESLEMVTMHEVGHNWFYGILGSNERAHPWMDEGLNTYMEGRYWNLLHQGKVNMLPDAVQKVLGVELTHSSEARIALDFQQGIGKDQAVEGKADEYAPINYGVIVYLKTGIAFEYLEEFLGEETLLECFRTYFDDWKFKHPSPKDLKNSFEKASGTDLDWFFDGYLQGVEKTDMKMGKVRGETYSVKNRSGIALPVVVSFRNKEGEEIHRHVTEPFEKNWTGEIPSLEEEIDRIVLNPDQRLPEFREGNNLYRMKGLFKKAPPLKLKFGYKYPNDWDFIINWVPVVGYNTYDKFMAGVLLHHNFFPKKKFEVYAMPMFAFGTTTLTGSSGFTYRWYPNKAFYRIELQGWASSFANLSRVRPSLEFYLRPKSEKSPFRHSFEVKAHIAAYGDSTLATRLPSQPVFAEFAWHSRCNKTIQKFEFDFSAGYSPGAGMSRIQGSGHIHRRFLGGQWMSLRAFAGYAPTTDTQFPALWFGTAGSGDPFGEQILFARNTTTGFLPRQIVPDQGAFRSLVPNRYNQGMLAFNFESTLGLKAVRAFADIGQGWDTFGSNDGWLWDAGISIGILNQAIRFNFPLAGTVFGGGFTSDGATFGQNINFTFEPLKLSGLINLPGN